MRATSYATAGRASGQGSNLHVIDLNEVRRDDGTGLAIKIPPGATSARPLYPALSG